MVRFLLTAVPFIWMIGCLPFANRVHPFVFGLPFLAFWIQLGVIVTVICVRALYELDRKR